MKHTPMKKYLVVSPVYEHVDPVCDDGTGPIEEYCDTVEIEARSAREAKVLAMRTDEFKSHVRYTRGDGVSPFSGVKAILTEDRA